MKILRFPPAGTAAKAPDLYRRHLLLGELTGSQSMDWGWLVPGRGGGTELLRPAGSRQPHPQSIWILNHIGSLRPCSNGSGAMLVQSMTAVDSSGSSPLRIAVPSLSGEEQVFILPPSFLNQLPPLLLNQPVKLGKCPVIHCRWSPPSSRFLFLNKQKSLCLSLSLCVCVCVRVCACRCVHSTTYQCSCGDQRTTLSVSPHLPP